MSTQVAQGIRPEDNESILVLATVADWRRYSRIHYIMRSHMISYLMALLTCLTTLSASAQDNTPNAEEKFKDGIASLQKNDLTQARNALMASLKLDPYNPVTLYNLGLVEQKSGNLGMALGLWRKTMTIHPEYAPAQQSIRWAKGKLERAEIPHEATLWESLRHIALAPFSLYKFVLFTAVFMLTGGWLWLKYFGARRRAILDGQPLPAFPVGALICTLGLLIMGFLSAAKALEQSTVRGTILVKKIEARSTPDTNGTPLFELYEGLEVIVRQSNDSWMQITYPGGPTGWIPQSALLTTAEDITSKKVEK
jgi:tetratricopeptide (TPR) repeat protein